MRATNLFGELEPVAIPLEEAATEAGVSIATIRNWIKTGYLQPAGKTSVAKDSLDMFMETIAGKEKLRIRANKQYKDTHDHGRLSAQVKLKVATESGEQVAASYERSLSNSYRNKEGIYYTPVPIVKDMLSALSGSLSGRIFMDPCCGSGNFLVEAIERGFPPEQVYGMDTDPNAVAIAKKRVFDLTGHVSDNIREGDFLELMAQHAIPNCDYVFTNPPWGKKLPKELRARYGSLLGAGNSTDTSCLFLLAGLSLVKEGGLLGYLMPGSFFNIASFEAARRKLLDLRIHGLKDYGKPFPGLLTQAQALFVANEKNIAGDALVECRADAALHHRSSASFKKNPCAILNFGTSSVEQAVIDHAYSVKHLTLAGHAQWGLGIVTGNNSKFVQTEPAAGLMPVYRGADIGPNGLKEAEAFIPKDLTLYQQVAPKTLYEAPEKLIYKFISSHLRFHVDREQRYMLNSANMLVPDRSFPLSPDQLAALLNSRFINWLFQRVFNTAKILRSDLEMLPLHVEYFNSHRSFVESDFLKHIGIELSPDGTYSNSQ